MSRLLLTAAVLAVLVYAMVLGVRWLSPRIEQDIAGRVTTGLAEQGLLWADVDVQGRDVVLSGVAPDADAKERALNVASRVFGVSKVEDHLVVAGEDVSGTVVGIPVATVPDSTDEIAAEAKAAGAYTLTIGKDGDKIVLSGYVPNDSDRDVLMRIAATHYGLRNVDAENLTVVHGAPAGWRSAVGAVLMHIANLEQAKVMISGTEVMVSGSVVDKQFSEQMEQAVTNVLPKSYKAAFAVEVVTPTVVAAEPAAGDENASMTCDSMADVKKDVLHFGFDKAELNDAHKDALQRVASHMAGCADAHVVVAGYTDTTGSQLYNRWLSQQRAEAGMRGLIRDGVEGARVKAVGYGEHYPVASNKTRAGRAMNRRVEFTPGQDLPHPMVKMHAVKKATKVRVLPVAKASSATTVEKEAIAKPWWAKTVSASVVTSDSVLKRDADGEAKLDAAVDHMVQPQPNVRKQPEWLGDQQ